ncbi:hypothetical protein WJX77_012161 [Trebouxia sp. C0004]
MRKDKFPAFRNREKVVVVGFTFGLSGPSARILSMARFASEAELDTFLGRLDLDYGPCGKHFDMTEKSVQIGRPVLLAGFPAASDQDFSRQPKGQPMITTGSICCYDRDRDFELAAATYQGAMPNSSGAPVLDNTRNLRACTLEQAITWMRFTPKTWCLCGSFHKTTWNSQQ